MSHSQHYIYIKITYLANYAIILITFLKDLFDACTCLFNAYTFYPFRIANIDIIFFV